MMRFAWGVVLTCLSLSLSRGASATEVPHHVRACGDVNEFPPYSYALREAGKKTSTVAGLDVDVLQKILRDSGRELSIELLPWGRCVAVGARGGYDIVMDGIKSPMREKDFDFPASHYSLTPVFLYLNDKPKPPMASREDMAQLRICSQADYNYEPYGVPNSLITNRAKSIEDSAAMLKLGRCNVMLQQVEVLRGNVQLGGSDLLNSAEFGHEMPAWLPGIDFYFMVGHKVPYRAELIDLLNRGVAAMKKSGELDRIRNRHQLR